MELTTEQKRFGKTLSVVNGRMMFAYLNSGCTEKDYLFVEDERTFPKSWDKALNKMCREGLISNYQVGMQSGKNYAYIEGFDVNNKYMLTSRKNIANFWLDENKLEELATDEFVFERVHKVRKEKEEPKQIEKAEIKKMEIRKSA